jgi:translation initiation factor 2B subunit (eIF-2B alpha/beta/delta family)
METSVKSKLNKPGFSGFPNRMREALDQYAKHMAKTGGDTAEKEAAISPSKRQRKEDVNLGNKNVAEALETALTPVISEPNVSPGSSENDDTPSAVTTSLKKAAKAKVTLYQQCRSVMRNTFVPLRPESDNRCKLLYSVHGLHCVGAVPYKDSPLTGKVNVASIMIKVKKKGFAKMDSSPGTFF